MTKKDAPPAPADTLLNVKQVAARMGYTNHASIYRQLHEGTFPIPVVRLTTRRLRFRESDLNDYLRNLGK